MGPAGIILVNSPITHSEMEKETFCNILQKFVGLGADGKNLSTENHISEFIR